MARQSHMAQCARGITKWKISPISQCRGEEKRLKESAGEEGGAAIIRLLLRETLSSVRDLVTSQYPITIFFNPTRNEKRLQIKRKTQLKQVLSYQ